ncbi:MAG: hypothetical protein KGL39_06165 [Patescibacteria group bacterium]|nr:hypothetical protein [Patescibacteria group bacterium]
MNEPPILFIPPKSITAYDKSLLRKAGILVVETPEPEKMKFTRAAVEVDAVGMMQAASHAISQSEVAQKAFAKAMCAILNNLKE